MSDYKRLTNTMDELMNPLDILTKCRDRLAELEDDLESGKIVRLPCAVGDTVYAIYQYRDFIGTTGEPFIEADIAEFFVYGDNKMKIVPSKVAQRENYWFKALHICVSREEAEKKLQELKRDV